MDTVFTLNIDFLPYLYNNKHIELPTWYYLQSGKQGRSWSHYL